MVTLIKAYDLECKKIIQKGLLTGNKIAEVTKKNIDFIVTGAHGAKDIEAILLDTNSEIIFEKVMQGTNQSWINGDGLYKIFKTRFCVT